MSTGAQPLPSDPTPAPQSGSDATPVPVTERRRTGSRPRPLPRDRARRKGLSGIFTALFGRNKDDDDGPLHGFEDEADETAQHQHPPVFDGEAPEGADVAVTWKDRTALARIEKLTESMVTVVAIGPVPDYYERVSLVPEQPDGRSAELVMYGTVTRIKDLKVNGERAFSIRFTKVDEKGNTGVFQEFLRVVNRA